MVQFIKNFLFVLLAAVISVVTYFFWLALLKFTIDFLRKQAMLEYILLANFYLKFAPEIFIGSWLWLSGEFLHKRWLKIFGRFLLIIAFVAPIIILLISFNFH